MIDIVIYRYSNSPHQYSPYQSVEDNLVILKQIHKGIQQRRLFDNEQCAAIEEKIDEVVKLADKGKYKPCTVDRAPLRNKWVYGGSWFQPSVICFCAFCNIVLVLSDQ